MVAKGLPVKVFKSAETYEEKIKRLTWHTPSRGKDGETSVVRAGYKDKLDAIKKMINVLESAVGIEKCL